MDLLQEYIFINLDIFRSKLDNNDVNIENELEAWLTFLSVDEPDIIIKLIEKYPVGQYPLKELKENGLTNVQGRSKATVQLMKYLGK